MFLFINLLAFLLILTGLILIVLNLPGALLIFGGILLSAWHSDFEVISGAWTLCFGLMTLLGLFLDNITMMLGAKRFGASGWGILGAFIGGFVCIFFMGPLGIVLGPFLGALIFELLFERKVIKEAARAGFGSLIGTLLGICGKLVVGLIMMAVWGYLILKFYLQ